MEAESAVCVQSGVQVNNLIPPILPHEKAAYLFIFFGRPQGPK